MRTEKEIRRLLLDTAAKDERIRQPIWKAPVCFRIFQKIYFRTMMLSML